MSLNLQIGSVYTFNTKAPAILGSQVKNARLEFSCNYEVAMKFENVDAKYRAIYPSLPIGTPVSPVGEVFHRFITESGARIFICESWIDGVVSSVTNLNCTIQLVNITTADRTKVIDSLRFLGVNFSIETN